MSEWQIVLLTGCLSILSAIITALISLALTHRNDVKKLILEKRASLYFDIYSELEKILNNPLKVFDEDYIVFLLSNKPKIKLLASTKTIEAFKSFFEFITQKYKEYKSFCYENDPRINRKFYRTFLNEEGEEDEEWLGTNFDITCFEQDEKKFLAENVPSSETISKHITVIYEEMRKDLGSNI